MRKTQSFIDANIKWKVLGDYVLRIETYRDSSPGLVIENCKSLVEAIFKTILVEVNSETEESLKECSTSNLYGKVKDILFLKNRAIATSSVVFPAQSANIGTSLVKLPMAKIFTH